MKRVLKGYIHVVYFYKQYLFDLLFMIQYDTISRKANTYYKCTKLHTVKQANQ